MTEILSITLEDWLRWRQKMELLVYKDGSIPLEDMAKYIDKLDQKFSHKNASAPASTRGSCAQLSPPVWNDSTSEGTRTKAKTQDACTQLHTVRQNFFSKHIMNAVKHRISSKRLAERVGFLGSLVASLSKDLIKVLALWLTGSSAVLENTKRTTSARSVSPTVLFLEAEPFLEAPTTVATMLSRDTSTALLPFLPPPLREEFTPAECRQSSTYRTPAEESLAGLFAVWGEGRLNVGRSYSSPILRSGWVCRVCRQDARRMYSYDRINRRLDHIDELEPPMEDPPSPPVKHRVGVSPGKRQQAESRSTSQATANGDQRGRSAPGRPMRGTGLSGQRQLCSVGFSKTLSSASPAVAATLFSGSVSRIIDDREDRFLIGNGISKREKGKKTVLFSR